MCIRDRPGEEHVAEIDPGVQLYVGLEAIGEPDAAGMRTVCLLYTSDAADELLCVDVGGRRII